MERSGTANLLRTIKPQLPEKKAPQVRGRGCGGCGCGHVGPTAVTRAVLCALQITCIAVDERQSLMAAGLVGGMVVLVKGNLVRYWSSRQQVLPFCLDNPITGLLLWRQVVAMETHGVGLTVMVWG